MRCRGKRATIRAVMRLTLLAPLTLALFVLPGCSNNGPERDRVVNIERLCTVYTGKDGKAPVPETYCASMFGDPQSAEEVSSADSRYPREGTIRLTVRTPQGTTYTIEVLPDTSIQLGDAWPPEGSR